jgi:hypothetical protein
MSTFTLYTCACGSTERCHTSATHLTGTKHFRLLAEKEASKLQEAARRGISQVNWEREVAAARAAAAREAVATAAAEADEVETAAEWYEKVVIEEAAEEKKKKLYGLVLAAKEAKAMEDAAEEVWMMAMEDAAEEEAEMDKIAKTKMAVVDADIDPYSRLIII